MGREDGPGPGWFTKAECALFLGISETAFHQYWAVKMSPDSIKRLGRRIYYFGPHVRDRIEAEAKKKSPKSEPVPPGEDPDIYSGSNSPNLERLRGLNADLKELELSQKRRESIPREEIHTALGRLAVILKGAGETLQRAYGPDAQKIIDEALDDFERETEDALAHHQREINA